MLKKTTKYLSSLRFTIVLISLLGVVFAVGLWVPQKRLLKTIYLQWQQSSPNLVSFLDALGLTTIYTSPITLTLWALFFLNLALVVRQRIPVIKGRIRLSGSKIGDPATAGGYSFRGSFPLPEGWDAGRVIERLRGSHFALLGDGNGFYAVKNRLAPVAFLLFHLSFFLILLGGLVSIYTEFIGYLDLAQGESFQGELARYNQSPQPKMPAVGSPPDLSFSVKSIVPRVTGNTPTGISVMLVDRKGQAHDVDINRPYAAGPASCVFKHLGVAPLLVLKDRSGAELGRAYFKLDVLQRKPDHFVFGGLSFTATFYPDFLLYNGQRASRSMEFKNPKFFFSAERDGRKVGEGVVARGETLQLGEYRLEMPDLPFWVRFYVVKQRGLSILYAGFALATIGVIWRLLFYRRELIGAVREVEGVLSLVVAGRSEYYQSLAEDEFNKLFAKILGRPERGEI